MKRPIILIGVVLFVVVACGAGVGHGQSSKGTIKGDRAHAEILRQLIVIKAAIEAGVTLRKFSALHHKLRAAADLAARDGGLSAKEKRSVDDALTAIGFVQSGWQELVGQSCTMDGKFLFDQAFCSNYLYQDFVGLGIGNKFARLKKKNEGLRFVDIDKILKTLLKPCLSKITQAIHVFSAGSGPPR